MSNMTEHSAANTIPGEMTGKRVLVTGAGTGIGHGIALEFGRAGADVVLHYSASSGAEAAAQTIREWGRRATAVQGDFRTMEGVRHTARAAEEFLGGIDILINNAGITANAPFEEVTPEHFDTLIHVNLRAQFFLTQSLLPQLQRNGKGIVVNLTSIHAYTGLTEHAVYAATKAAIVSYTRVAALELIQKGVRMNAIAPGWIFVENHAVTLGHDFDFEAAGRGIPAGFIGTPEDVAKLALFLASDASRYIVGQTIICDGGQTLVMPLTGDYRGRRNEKWGDRYLSSETSRTGS
jgi:NAD(P)-dependent dehydrogenase (short-subunit alcohol dehydrogenase family)